MVKTSDLREREVVNVRDGSRLGMISDIEVNLETGVVESVVVPGPGKILGLFGRNQDIVIRWSEIVKIGTHVILVDISQDWQDNLRDEDDSY